jgi:hypothetical protein
MISSFYIKVPFAWQMEPFLLTKNGLEGTGTFIMRNHFPKPHFCSTFAPRQMALAAQLGR